MVVPPMIHGQDARSTLEVLQNPQCWYTLLRRSKQHVLTVKSEVCL